MDGNQSCRTASRSRRAQKVPGLTAGRRSLVALAGRPASRRMRSPRRSHCPIAHCRALRAGRCGELVVPENPKRPVGRRLRIAVAVVPATGGKALPDPIVPLMGGPGEDAISAGGDFVERLGSLGKDRDLLLVDQRGTGKSDILRCDLHDPEAPAPNRRDFLPPAAVQACASELSQRADLTQYTYLHFARDLEQVRQALGYEKLNLFAGSYGTRAAQVYLRAYPESVRTVYLGSVVPIDEVTPVTMATASQAVFESTFDACAADVACRTAFPNLRAEFDEVLERLDSGNVRVPVAGWLPMRLRVAAGSSSGCARSSTGHSPPRHCPGLFTRRTPATGRRSSRGFSSRPEVSTTMASDSSSRSPARRTGLSVGGRDPGCIQEYVPAGLPRAPAASRLSALAEGAASRGLP